MIYSTLQYSKKDSNPPAQVLKTHQQDKHVPYVIKEIGNGGGKKNKGKKKKKWSQGEVITLNAGISKVGLVAGDKLQIWLLRSLEPKWRRKQDYLHDSWRWENKLRKP